MAMQQGGHSDRGVPAALWVLLSSVSFALMGLCIKQVGGRLPVAEVVLARAIVSLVLSVWMLHQAGVSPWGQRRWLLVWRGVVGTIALFCVFGALAGLPLGAATVLQYLNPTFTALLAWIWLGEPFTLRIALAVLLGWLGVVVLTDPTQMVAGLSSLPLPPVMLGLAGAFCSAVAYVSVRALGRSEHPLVVVFYFPLMSLPMTVPLVLANPVMPTGTELIWLVGVGVFTQLGQIGITKGLIGLPAARATAIGYGQVPIAALLGVLVLGETIPTNLLLAAALVLAATLLSLRRTRALTTG
jgi:drug/metabolite transporter (DMT)-like permease